MNVAETVARVTGARSVDVLESVQSLWSGYGEILRVALDGRPAIVKHVAPPTRGNHPRGWNTNRSHERKLQSYAVEFDWYGRWAGRCDDACRVAQPIALETLEGGGWLFVMEDLDDAGFPMRRSRLGQDAVLLGLRWLAEFHAVFMGEKPDGLWPVGTYWHLETRPEELRAMQNRALRAAADDIDARLSEASYQTIVHGDAKVANFCFSRNGAAVAAVDFQYVGGGCGMKDIAYFLGSCLDEKQCERREAEHLGSYFESLTAALARRRPEIDAAAVEREWRPLYYYAWADFYRFLDGWSPGHPKMNPYSERIARDVLAGLHT